jgi:hypothetical protein
MSVLCISAWGGGAGGVSLALTSDHPTSGEPPSGQGGLVLLHLGGVCRLGAEASSYFWLLTTMWIELSVSPPPHPTPCPDLN